MESRFEVWRAGFKLGGLIEGLEGRFEVWEADLGHGRGADLKPRGRCPKSSKTPKKKRGPTDGPTKWVVESRSTQVEKLCLLIDQ